MTSAHRPGASIPYRKDLDGLRAIAILCVLVFHFQLAPHVLGGFLGVDIFFVISGFLITSILKSQLQEGSFNLATFYLRRVRRLAPALVFTLAATLLAGSLLLFSNEFVLLARETLFAQLYCANIYYWQHLNYFGIKANESYLIHTWSLAVEEQFYLFYPPLLLGAYRILKGKAHWALTLGALLSFGLNLVLLHRKPEATFYLLPTRAFELFLGGMAAYVPLHWLSSRSVRELCGWLGLLTIFGSVIGYEESIRFPGWFALLPCLGTVLLLTGGTLGDTRTARFLALPALRYIGNISYTVYLVHWPIRVFVTEALINQASYLERLSAALASLLVGAAVSHWIEMPVRRGKWLASSRALLGGYAAAAGLTVAACFLILQKQGIPERFSAETRRIASYSEDFTGHIPCEFSPQGFSFCNIGVKDKAPSWLVFGDSHAWAAHAVFDQWLTSRGESGQFVFLHACVPLRGLHNFGEPNDGCFVFNEAMYQHLAQPNSPPNVFLVSTWLEGLLVSAERYQKLDPKSSRALFDRKFAEAMRELTSYGKKVYVWEPVPGANGHVPIYLARAGSISARPAGLLLSRDRYDKRFEFFFENLRANRDLITATFSPRSMLCNSGVCDVAKGDTPLYSEGAHLSRSSAPFWVGALNEQITQTALH